MLRWLLATWLAGFAVVAVRLTCELWRDIRGKGRGPRMLPRPHFTPQPQPSRTSSR